MKKQKMLFVFTAVTLLLVAAFGGGCGGSKDPGPATGKYEIIRKSGLGAAWQMYQIRIVLEAGNNFDVDLLGLSGADKVDGYFYLEKGTGAALVIKAGDSVLYQSAAAAGGEVVSDRFSFIAGLPAGTAYVFNFSNPGTETVNVFLELIYPKTGFIRGPIDTNK